MKTKYMLCSIMALSLSAISVTQPANAGWGTWAKRALAVGAVAGGAAAAYYYGGVDAETLGNVATKAGEVATAAGSVALNVAKEAGQVVGDGLGYVGKGLSYGWTGLTTYALPALSAMSMVSSVKGAFGGSPTTPAQTSVQVLKEKTPLQQ